MKINIMFILALVLTLALFTSCGKKENDDTGSKNIKKVAEGLSFPEGPAYNGGDKVYFSNCYADWVGVIQEGKTDTFVSKPTEPYNFGKTNGLTFGFDGNLYGCDYENGAIVKFSMNGKCDTIVSGYRGERFNRPNDLAFNRAGYLYFSDPTTDDAVTPRGRLFRKAPLGKVELLLDSLAYPNGMAFSEDEKFLYLSESAKSRVLRLTLDDDGNITKKEVFFTVPENDPDGLALDEEGNLYVAHFGGGVVHVVSPEGKKLSEIKVPGNNVSNVEFAGDDNKTLYITEDENNAIYSYRNDIAGMTLSPLR